MTDAYTKSEKSLKHIAVIIFSAFVILLLAFYRNVQQDDAYIAYTYAKNIANGNGYVFNEGERVNATTSTLYTITLASVYSLLRWLPFITLPIIGHLIGATSLWVIAFFSMKMFRETGLRVVPLIFPVLFLANPLLKNAVGMETFLTLALFILSLYLYSREKLFLLSAVCALAILSRPDSIILPFILMVDYVIRKRRVPPWGPFAIFALVLILWVAFNYLYFRSVLPCTLSVKLGQTQSGRWGTGFIFLKGLMSTAWPYTKFTKWPVAISVAVAGIYLTVVDRTWARYRVVVLIFIWSLAYLVVYGIILNPPAYPWYYTPLSIPIALLLALVPEMVARRQTSRGWVGYTNYIVFFPLVVGAIGLAVLVKSLNEPVSAKYENYKLATEWLNDNVFKGATVAANEIGVLGYFYRQGKVIDGLGLVTPGVADHVRQQDYTWYVHEYQPDFLMFNHPHRRILEAMVNEKWFQQQYQKTVIIQTKRKAVAIYRRR